MLAMALYGSFHSANPHFLYDRYPRLYSVSFLGYIVYYAFIISIVNIPIFGISGFILLIQRQRIGLAILLVTAVLAYVIFLRLYGDEL
jgi:hypothetical protein